MEVMPDEKELWRTLGNIEAKLNNHDNKQEEIKTLLKEHINGNNKRLRTVEKDIQTGKIFVGTVSAAAATVVSYIDHIKALFRH